MPDCDVGAKGYVPFGDLDPSVILRSLWMFPGAEAPGALLNTTGPACPASTEPVALRLFCRRCGVGTALTPRSTVAAGDGRMLEGGGAAKVEGEGARFFSSVGIVVVRVCARVLIVLDIEDVGTGGLAVAAGQEHTHGLMVLPLAPSVGAGTGGLAATIPGRLVDRGMTLVFGTYAVAPAAVGRAAGIATCHGLLPATARGLAMGSKAGGTGGLPATSRGVAAGSNAAGTGGLLASCRGLAVGFSAAAGTGGLLLATGSGLTSRRAVGGPRAVTGGVTRASKAAALLWNASMGTGGGGLPAWRPGLGAGGLPATGWAARRGLGAAM